MARTKTHADAARAAGMAGGTLDERVRAVVLARLLASKHGLGRGELSRSVRGWLTRMRAPEAAAERVEPVLDDCLRAALLAPAPVARRSRDTRNTRPRSAALASKAGPVTITARGRAWLQAQLAIERLPGVTSWRKAQHTLVTMLAVGPQYPPSGSSVDALAAAIIARGHALPARSASLRQVVDALAWRALGRETDAPFDAARVQRWLLRDLSADDARIDHETWRRLIAAKLVGAARPDAESLRAALVTRWLQAPDTSSEQPPRPRAPQRAAASRQGALEAKRPRAGTIAAANTAAPARVARVPDRPSSAAAQVDPDRWLHEFAEAVQRGARAPGVARFHDDRAFIGSLWQHLQGKPPIGTITLAEFKARLLLGHRNGQLRLTRADLTSALDPQELQRSEVRHLGMSFHFVALETANG